MPSAYRSYMAGAVLALTLALPARADFIAPGSIDAAPTMTDPANGSPVAAPEQLVAGQYASLGVTFLPGPGERSAVALTKLGGADVWVPVSRTEAMADRVGVVDYSRYIKASLGGVTDRLTLEVMADTAFLVALDRNGEFLSMGHLSGERGAHGGVLATVEGDGIAGFLVNRVQVIDVMPGEAAPSTPWGIASVQTGPAVPLHHAPEPATWVLAVVGVIACWRCRPLTPKPSPTKGRGETE